MYECTTDSSGALFKRRFQLLLIGNLTILTENYHISPFCQCLQYVDDRPIAVGLVSHGHVCYSYRFDRATITSIARSPLTLPLNKNIVDFTAFVKTSTLFTISVWSSSSFDYVRFFSRHRITKREEKKPKKKKIHAWTEKRTQYMDKGVAAYISKALSNLAPFTIVASLLRMYHPRTRAHYQPLSGVHTHTHTHAWNYTRSPLEKRFVTSRRRVLIFLRWVKGLSSSFFFSFSYFSISFSILLAFIVFISFEASG